MRKLILVLPLVICLSSSISVAAFNQAPSINFQGYFGEATTDSDPQNPPHAIGSLFIPDLLLNEQTLISIYRDEPGVSLKRGHLDGLKLYSFEYVNPSLLEYGPDQIADAPSIGQYLYQDKNMIGYHIVYNIGIEHGYESDQNLVKIKSLPSKSLSSVPGTNSLIPEGVSLVEYSTVNGSYIERYIIATTAEHQSLISFSFYPQAYDSQLLANAANVFQQQITAYKKWRT